MPKCWQIDLNFKKRHRMHQNSPFWDPQSKHFLGRGHCPLPRPLFQWGGENPLPTTHPHRRLRRLDSHAFGVWPRRLRRFDQCSPQCWIEIYAHMVLGIITGRRTSCWSYINLSFDHISSIAFQSRVEDKELLEKIQQINTHDTWYERTNIYWAFTEITIMDLGRTTRIIQCEI